MDTSDSWRNIIEQHMDSIIDKCSELYFKAWEDQSKDFHVTIDRSGNVDSRICKHGLIEHSSSWYAGESIELACFSFYQADTVIRDEDIVSLLTSLGKEDILAELESEQVADKLGYLAEIGEHDLIHALDKQFITDNKAYYINLGLKNVLDFLAEKEPQPGAF